MFPLCSRSRGFSSRAVENVSQHATRLSFKLSKQLYSAELYLGGTRCHDETDTPLKTEKDGSRLILARTALFPKPAEAKINKFKSF